MSTTLAQQISELTLRREKIKQELFVKEAERLRNKEKYYLYQEGTSKEERIALECAIAHLESDRQSTKVELMKLKIQARESRERTLIKLLIEAFDARGLYEEVEKARKAADDALMYEGLFEAYTVNL